MDCPDIKVMELARYVQAWQYLNPEQVIAAARALDRSGRRGGLIGSWCKRKVPLPFDSRLAAHAQREREKKRTSAEA